ncbi:MAG: acylphosphatase [Thermodesulfobacteriota bacterium]
MPDIRAHLVIQGWVQGVWFRESTRQEARRLGLTGWVRNRPDGSVEVTAEGDELRVEELVQWCHEGPPMARVDRVDVRRTQATGEFSSFRVTF